MTLTLLSRAPLLAIADDLVPTTLLDALRAMGDDLDAPHRDVTTGTSVEPMRGQHHAADALLDLLADTLGVAPSPDDSIRWRRYQDAQSHPPHTDTYAVGQRRLVATALVCIDAPQAGGQTFFPCALPDPVAVSMRPARLILWINERAHGEPDPASLHAGLAVQGVKTTATWFIYLDQADADALRARVTALPLAPHDPPDVRRGGQRLYYLGASSSPQTGGWLRDACATRGVGFVEIDPHEVDHLALRPLPPGSLLYRAGGSLLAQRVEAMLIGPGVGHLWATDDGPLREVWHDVALLRAGLPMPRRSPLSDDDPDRLKALASKLGGFPLVLRFPGGSGGIGVIRVDSLPALTSLAQWALAQGHSPELMAYIPDATHWRVIIIDQRAAATYINPARPDDFRSEASEDGEHYDATPPDGVVELARRATAALAKRMGGVDILVHPSGRMYLLEVNFPCYFGHAQEAGRDVAGAMIEAMLASAATIAP